MPRGYLVRRGLREDDTAEFSIPSNLHPEHHPYWRSRLITYLVEAGSYPLLLAQAEALSDFTQTPKLMRDTMNGLGVSRDGSLGERRVAALCRLYFEAHPNAV